MTGFRVNPEALDQHAGQVDALSKNVVDGAAAETQGTAQADFGVLIGNTLGSGIRALAEHFEQGLQGAAKALDATSAQLRTTACGYREAEQSNHQQVTDSGGGL